MPKKMAIGRVLETRNIVFHNHVSKSIQKPTFVTYRFKGGKLYTMAISKFDSVDLAGKFFLY